MKLSYDLHIHSCLSPCGDDDMTPANITGMAALLGLDLIAVTDHNSCKNCPAVLALAKEYGIIALPGMELTTSEEVHVVCLFARLEDAMAFDAYVYDHLVPFPNNEKIFGKQQIYNAQDEVIDTIPNLLINATTISFDDVWELMTRFNGLMIPAHIDKHSNSLIFNLGFIPPDSQFTCVEVHDPAQIDLLKAQNPYLAGCRIISDSDAHYLEHIHEPVHFLETKSRSPEDIIQALSSQI